MDEIISYYVVNIIYKLITGKYAQTNLSGHNMNIQQRPVASEHSERMIHQHLRTMLVGL